MVVNQRQRRSQEKKKLKPRRNAFERLKPASLWPQQFKQKIGLYDMWAYAAYSLTSWTTPCCRPLRRRHTGLKAGTNFRLRFSDMSKKDDTMLLLLQLCIYKVANRNKKKKKVIEMYFHQFCTVYKHAKRKQ